MVSPEEIADAIRDFDSNYTLFHELSLDRPKGELSPHCGESLERIRSLLLPDDWSDWIYTAEAKRKFGIESPQGWTSFAKKLRDQGLLKNHPQSGAKRVQIHRSVFTSRGIPFPS